MFQLQILSPLGEVFNDSIDEVLLPTTKGEIAVLSNHIPLFSKLTEGTLTIKKGSKENVIAIVGGFIEVKNNVVTILSDYAIKAEDIQTAKALEAQKMAEELIKNKQSTADLIMAEKQLQKALLELKVLGKIRHHN